MSTGKKWTRRQYQTTALVAVRKARTMCFLWTRRGRKSTTLADAAFGVMSSAPGQSVIAASASLLVGSELVAKTLNAIEQAAIVAREADAVNAALQNAATAGERQFNLVPANSETGKEYTGLTPEDFRQLYRASQLELRLYFDRTSYSRERIIAPRPATARGWGGWVFRDEAMFTPPDMERDLRIAVNPIVDEDPTFRLIYASNIGPEDRHPLFEDTLPAKPEDAVQVTPPNPAGHFYIGETGMLVHRVTIADAYAAGHVLYNKRDARPMTLEEFKKSLSVAERNQNYDLVHEFGGAAAIDLLALGTAQQRGIGQCAFVYVESDADFERALLFLRQHLKTGEVGIGFDVATTTKQISNPSSVAVTEKFGLERFQRLNVAWKEKKPKIARERVRRLIEAVRDRPVGGPAKRLCIDASSERYFAEETADEFRGLIPVQLVMNGAAIHPQGYEQSINYKTWLGDIYSDQINENHYTLPPETYLKEDHRLVTKSGGTYNTEPQADGKHGDTFDGGKLAELALVGTEDFYFAPIASSRHAAKVNRGRRNRKVVG